MKKLKLSEKDVQTSIMDYLDKKRIFHYRQNSGAIRTEYKGRKGFYKFASMNGLPDIVAVKDGIYYGIECKGSSGQLSDNQLSFMDKLEHAGGKYVLARSLGDIMELFNH